MKLTFLGTRGYIDARTRRHRRHTCTLFEYRGQRVLVDWGEDWVGRLDEVGPRAVVVTHAHPDHAGGLGGDVRCPVYATDATWDELGDRGIGDREIVEPRRPLDIAGLRFEAFPVEHSIRAPAVGYRVTAGRVAVFYVPDVVYIPEREAALSGCKLYVGDGATITRSMVRRRGDRLFGHAPIRTQLTWCAKEGVPEAVFTHCGSEIVTGDERTLGARVRALARERDVDAEIAHDGMERVLR